jgi:hypothetical protein
VKNKGQSGFSDYKRRIQKTKDHVVLSNLEMRKGCGPSTLGFGVWGLAITNAKHQHTTTPKSQKCEWIMGLVLQGFGVHDFGVYEYPTPQTTILELQKKNKWSVGPVLFGFRGLQTPDEKHRTMSNVESRKHKKGVGPNQYRVSVFGNS